MKQVSYWLEVYTGAHVPPWALWFVWLTVLIGYIFWSAYQHDKHEENARGK